MLVLKFGGTSVADQAAIVRLVQIVRATRRCIPPPSIAELARGADCYMTLIAGV